MSSFALSLTRSKPTLPTFSLAPPFLPSAFYFPPSCCVPFESSKEIAYKRWWLQKEHQAKREHDSMATPYRRQRRLRGHSIASTWTKRASPANSTPIRCYTLAPVAVHPPNSSLRGRRAQTLPCCSLSLSSRNSPIPKLLRHF